LSSRTGRDERSRTKPKTHVKDLDISLDLRDAVLIGDLDLTERFSIDNALSVAVGELGTRPGERAKKRGQCGGREDEGRERRDSLDDGPLEGRSNYSPISGDGEEDREGESLLSGDEAAELLAEGRRKHGNGSLNEVDGGRSLSSISIESSVGLDLKVISRRGEEIS